MKEISFILNKQAGTVTLLVNNQAVTGWFDLYNDELVELIFKLAEFADVPVMADVSKLFANFSTETGINYLKSLCR